MLGRGGASLDYMRLCFHKTKESEGPQSLHIRVQPNLLLVISALCPVLSACLTTQEHQLTGESMPVKTTETYSQTPLPGYRDPPSGCRAETWRPFLPLSCWFQSLTEALTLSWVAGFPVFSYTQPYLPCKLTLV